MRCASRDCAGARARSSSESSPVARAARATRRCFCGTRSPRSSGRWPRRCSPSCCRRGTTRRCARSRRTASSGRPSRRSTSCCSSRCCSRSRDRCGSGATGCPRSAVSASERVERAAELLERLLTDAGFRARFRQSPEAVCREAGFGDLAEEIARSLPALQTLDDRESRSSLVGALMAAAVEGMGVLELSRIAGGGFAGDAAEAAHRALARTGLPGGGHAGAAHAAPALVPKPHAPPGLHAGHIAGRALHPGHAAAAEARAAMAPDAGPSSARAAPAAGGGSVPATAAASPGTALQAGAGAARAGAPAAGTGTGTGAVAPDAAVATPPADPAGTAGAPAAAAGTAETPDQLGSGAPGGAGTGSATADPPWPVGPGAAHGAGGSPGDWPGAGGGGDAHGEAIARVASTGSSGAHAQAAFAKLLDDPRVQASAEVRTALLSGSADPRLADVLHTLSATHEIGLAAGAGGVLEITSVDGTAVSAGNPAARELLGELAALDPSRRPEVVSPWSISAPGFTTDDAHQAQIEIRFRDAHGQDAGHAADAAHRTPDHAGTADAADAGGGGFDAAAAAADYPGDGATKAQLADWMGRWAQRAGLPRELPVMAALVESTLSNVPPGKGDLDSAGFFQMRTSIWLERYPGYPTHPALQLKWFIDNALAHKAGRDTHDPGQWGEWIADVENCRGDLRGKYQLQLNAARQVLGHSGGDSASGSGAGPSPSSAADQTPQGGTSSPASGASASASAASSAGAGAAGPGAGAAGASSHDTISFAAAAPPAAGPHVDPSAAGDAVLVKHGSAVTAPGTAQDRVRTILERAMTLDRRHLPYDLGGGHQAGVANVSTVGPVDCSGAVSAVLGVDARVSGLFESWGEPGPGAHVTVYANEEHVLMEIDGHFFGTSHANPRGGAGWIPRAHISPDYLKAFTVRHPRGL